MRHKTADLSGALLDAAAWLALKQDYPAMPGTTWPTSWSPSTDWAHGGPIIERERIVVGPSDDEGWVAYVDGEVSSSGSDDLVIGSHAHGGDSPLVAVMRSFVASRLGEEVELP